MFSRYKYSTIFSRFLRDWFIIERRSSIVCGVIAARSIYRWSGPNHANEFIRFPIPIDTKTVRSVPPERNHKSSGKKKERKRRSLEIIVLGTHVRACSSSLKLHDDAFICDYYPRSQRFYAFNSETRRVPLKKDGTRNISRRRDKFVCRAIDRHGSSTIGAIDFHSHATRWEKLRVKRRGDKKKSRDKRRCRDARRILRCVLSLWEAHLIRRMCEPEEDDVTDSAYADSLTRCTRFPCRCVHISTLHIRVRHHAHRDPNRVLPPTRARRLPPLPP